MGIVFESKIDKTNSLNTSRNHPSYLIPFILIISLFFLWGFAISMLDVLNKHFQEALNISKAKSGLIQLVVYGAYFLIALPAGSFIKKYGYKKGVILGLMLYSFGSFLFYPAVTIKSYYFFLFCLFMIGCGLATLETAANPYVTILGDPKRAAQRLNLAQSFNGIGVILGPLVGGLLVFAKNNDNGNSLSSIQLPYVVVGFVVLLIALLFIKAPLPELHVEIDKNEFKQIDSGSLLMKNHFVYAVIAQFFYVGAQAGIWGFFINYTTEMIKGMTNQNASFYLSGAMILFTIGRFSSTFIMRVIKPNKLLFLYSIISLILILVVINNLGMLSVYALMVICFCMGIMFPTIFVLGINNLGNQTKRGASIMIMSIVGGAVIPPSMGLIADHFNTSIAFCLPGFCFLIVSAFALKGYKN
jgi:FHS family L-fucose permease-like MFS transporter